MNYARQVLNEIISVCLFSFVLFNFISHSLLYADYREL